MGEGASKDPRSAAASDESAISRLLSWLMARPLLAGVLAAIAAALLVAGMVAVLYMTIGPSAAEPVVAEAESAAGSTGESVPPTSARLELATDSIDLGHIPQDEEVEYLLEITNVGGEPLTISEVRTS